MGVVGADLRTVPLLAGIKDKELAKLAGSFKERHVRAGDPILEQGTGGVAFFLLLEGTAEVETASGGREIGPGDYVGEMALLGADVPRSATVRAKTDVRLGHISAWEFRPFLKDHPELALDMLEVMANRLRDAEAEIRRLRA